MSLNLQQLPLFENRLHCLVLSAEEGQGKSAFQYLSGQSILAQEVGEEQSGWAYEPEDGWKILSNIGKLLL